jgi:hypothetical protein
MKQLPIVLSVDWDYFLPFCTDQRYDWGHHEENPLFYETIWACRAVPWPGRKEEDNPLHAVTLDGARVRNFWSKVLAPGLPVFACVADSHKTLAQFIGQLTGGFHVINFDAHHDCGYDRPSKKCPPLDCSTWGAVLRRKRVIQNYTLVYPEWRKEEPESEANHPLVDQIMYGDWPDKPIAADFVFICRSSCWMPPWCDQDWLDFRQGLLMREPMGLQEVEYVTKARPFVQPVIA